MSIESLRREVDDLEWEVNDIEYLRVRRDKKKKALLYWEAQRAIFRQYENNISGLVRELRRPADEEAEWNAQPEHAFMQSSDARINLEALNGIAQRYSTRPREAWNGNMTREIRRGIGRDWERRLERKIHDVRKSRYSASRVYGKATQNGESLRTRLRIAQNLLDDAIALRAEYELERRAAEQLERERTN